MSDIIRILFGNLMHTSRGNLLRYAVFCAISFILWCLTELKNEFTSTMDFPVIYTNQQNNKVLTTQLPTKLSLRLHAIGNTLLKYKLNSSFNVIEFDLSHDLIKIDEDHGYILTNRRISRIDEQFPNNIDVIAVYPDTLFVSYDDMGRKMVPIHADMNIECEHQFFVGNDILIQPDSIMVEGPIPIIDTLYQINTIAISRKKVSDTINITLSLIKNHDLLKYSKDDVYVSIPVEKYTEAKVEVPITIINIPDNLYVRLFPNKISLHCMVGLSNYERLNHSFFKAVVDYNQIVNQKKLKVDLIVAPDFVKQINFTPGSVDYLIEK